MSEEVVMPNHCLSLIVSTHLKHCSMLDCISSPQAGCCSLRLCVCLVTALLPHKTPKLKPSLST